MSIKKEIIELSEKLTGAIAVDKAGSTEVNGDPFVENLPEGLDMATVEAVKDYNATFIAASGHAFGKAAISAMAKTKSLAETNVSFGMGGKDKVDHTFIRSYEAKAPGAAEGVQKWGKMVTTVTVDSHRPKVGQLGQVRQALAADAAEKLAK